MDTKDHDELDRLLRRLASPTTQVTPAVEDELASLTIATRRASRPVVRKNAWRLSLAAGIPVVAVFGIGAAAMATGLWAPWAQTPDGTFTYTLPSGVICEARVGEIQVENPEIQRALQDIFATTNVVAASDVVARNELLLSEDSALEYARATVEGSSSSGYGTIEDVIYGMAVRGAVLETLNEELVERGFDVSNKRNMLSLRGQWLCGDDVP